MQPTAFQKFFDTIPGGLFMTLHGSRLFGVANNDSDWDAKVVRLPAAEQLLLGDRRALTPVARKSDTLEVTVHALQQFLGMLERADTNAIDMLFAAEAQCGLLAASPAGERFLTTVDPARLVPRRLSGALGYARNQASKYSRKGARLALLEHLMELLSAKQRCTTGEALQVTSMAHFEQFKAELTLVGVDASDLAFEERAASNGGVQRFLMVNDKALDLNARAAYNLAVLKSTAEAYGERARQAQADNGRDLKAWYHALRVTGQALELHQTGGLTFPRPDAPFLREVRAGQYDSEELRERLEKQLALVDEAEQASVLRAEFDGAYAQELVLNLYQ